MEKEYNNGYGSLFNGNDNHASNQSFFTTSDGEQTEKKGVNPADQPYIDFNQSNRKMDNYFLHFSSWL